MNGATTRAPERIASSKYVVAALCFPPILHPNMQFPHWAVLQPSELREITLQR